MVIIPREVCTSQIVIELLDSDSSSDDDDDDDEADKLGGFFVARVG